MKKQKYKLRLPELVLTRRLGLTEESYRILKDQKRIQSKSMARIVDDMIKETYALQKEEKVLLLGKEKK